MKYKVNFHVSGYVSFNYEGMVEAKSLQEAKNKVKEYLEKRRLNR